MASTYIVIDGLDREELTEDEAMELVAQVHSTVQEDTEFHTDSITLTDEVGEDDQGSLAAEVGDLASDPDADLTGYERSKLEDAAHLIARTENPPDGEGEH